MPSDHYTTVDCIGSCETGRGYCYAREGVCFPCVLWDPDPILGEVLCSAPMRAPQGGPLPGSPAWGPRCTNPDRVQPLPGAACASEQVWARARPQLQVISASGRLVSTLTPPIGLSAGTLDNPSLPREYASALCLDPSASPPLAHSLGFELLNVIDFIEARSAQNCSLVQAAIEAARPATAPAAKEAQCS